MILGGSSKIVEQSGQTTLPSWQWEVVEVFRMERIERIRGPRGRPTRSSILDMGKQRLQSFQSFV